MCVCVHTYIHTHTHTQLNVFKYRKWLNICIWPIDETLIGTTIQGQSEPESNDNERILHIPLSSKTEASSSGGLISYSGYLLGSLTPLERWGLCILQPHLTGLKVDPVNILKVIYAVIWFLSLKKLEALVPPLLLVNKMVIKLFQEVMSDWNLVLNLLQLTSQTNVTICTIFKKYFLCRYLPKYVWNTIIHIHVPFLLNYNCWLIDYNVMSNHLGYFMLRELHSLYVHIYIFGEFFFSLESFVLSLGFFFFFFFLHKVLSNTNF